MNSIMTQQDELEFKPRSNHLHHHRLFHSYLLDYLYKQSYWQTANSFLQEVDQNINLMDSSSYSSSSSFLASTLGQQDSSGSTTTKTGLHTCNPLHKSKSGSGLSTKEVINPPRRASIQVDTPEGFLFTCSIGHLTRAESIQTEHIQRPSSDTIPTPQPPRRPSFSSSSSNPISTQISQPLLQRTPIYTASLELDPASQPHYPHTSSHSYDSMPTQIQPLPMPSPQYQPQPQVRHPSMSSGYAQVPVASSSSTILHRRAGMAPLPPSSHPSHGGLTSMQVQEHHLIKQRQLQQHQLEEQQRENHLFSASLVRQQTEYQRAYGQQQQQSQSQQSQQRSVDPISQSVTGVWMRKSESTNPPMHSPSLLFPQTTPGQEQLMMNRQSPYLLGSNGRPVGDQGFVASPSGSSEQLNANSYPFPSSYPSSNTTTYQTDALTAYQNNLNANQNGAMLSLQSGAHHHHPPDQHHHSSSTPYNSRMTPMSSTPSAQDQRQQQQQHYDQQMQNQLRQKQQLAQQRVMSMSSQQPQSQQQQQQRDHSSQQSISRHGSISQDDLNTFQYNLLPSRSQPLHMLPPSPAPSPAIPSRALSSGGSGKVAAPPAAVTRAKPKPKPVKRKSSGEIGESQSKRKSSISQKTESRSSSSRSQTSSIHGPSPVIVDSTLLYPSPKVLPLSLESTSTSTSVSTPIALIESDATTTTTGYVSMQLVQTPVMMSESYSAGASIALPGNMEGEEGSGDASWWTGLLNL